MVAALYYDLMKNSAEIKADLKISNASAAIPD